jgi:membrane-associated phospholipid phosphatase
MTEARSTLWSQRELRRVFAGALATLVLVFVALTVYLTRSPRPPHVASFFDEHVRAYPGSPRYVLAGWSRAVGSPPALVAATVLAAALCALRWRRRDLAVLCVLAPLLAGAAELAVKGIFDRGMTHAAELEGAFGAGFPSGHAAGITALAVAVVLSAFELTRDARVHLAVGGAAVVLVTAVAAGSVVGGAHRSLDVVGGVLLGVAAALAVFIAMSMQRDLGDRSARSARSGPR